MATRERFRFRLPDDVFQLEITLVESEPPIWRRLLVDQEVLLPRFHRILQIVMGWTDSHLHQFKVSGITFGEPNDEFDPGPIDYRRVTLNQMILPTQGASCVYEYDFGDSWEQLIELEDDVPRDNLSVRPPRCTDGARACPPEDCGGIHGYELFLSALVDQSDPEHNDYVRWSGGSFDPDAFDLEAVNKRLARAARSSRASK